MQDPYRVEGEQVMIPLPFQEIIAVLLPTVLRSICRMEDFTERCFRNE